MLTPQEVSDKKFVKAVFGGYDMTMVDDFLEIVTDDYGNLYKENAVLKSKLKVLVETVEEYRSVDDAMRKTLSNAQKMADKIIAEAELKRDELLGGAERDSKARIEEIREGVAKETRHYDSVTRQTADFIERVKHLYLAQIEALDTPFIEQTFTESVSADKIEEAAEAIFRSMEEKLSEAAQPEPEPVDVEDTAVYDIVDPRGGAPVSEEIVTGDDGEGEYELSPKPKFEFQDLKFGKEYQVNNNKK